tara:strand:- start:1996 stop:2148 length:153 start_codon:yes stop_codon:yes gene_type:complete
MLNDPSLADLYNQTTEEYYDDLAEFDIIGEKTDDDCPSWIQEQLDEEIPF